MNFITVPIEHTNPEGEKFWTCEYKVDKLFSVTGWGKSPQEAEASLIRHLLEMNIIHSPVGN